MRYFSLLALLAASSAHAGNASHDATSAEIRAAVLANEAYHRRAQPTDAARPFRPVEDTANFAYVLMSAYDEQSDEVSGLRETIARNLPAGVKLVILADEPDAASMRAQYGQWISSDRLIVATDADTSNGFWARDSFPVPVYDSAAKRASLVAANYYRPFSAQGAVAGGVHGAMAKKEFTFVGGNLLSDEDGNCFSVDSYRRFTVTDDDLTQAYGCHSVHLMKHVRGLGDADEVLKPLSGKRILTNSPEYRSELEALGYTLVLLPTLPETYRTYVNALTVNGVVFMPSYGVPEDDVATKVYESLGYRVFPIRTNSLSDEMHGSVHCQTMAYPAMPESSLLGGLGLKRLP